jgi:hypothetical protein
MREVKIPAQAELEWGTLRSLGRPFNRALLTLLDCVPKIRGTHVTYTLHD